MPVEIKIFGESAKQSMAELWDLAEGMFATPLQRNLVVDGSSAPIVASELLAEQGRDIHAAVAENREPEAPKRTRRTKAQIEADEAAAKAAAQAPAISATPEDRTNPDDAAGDPAEEEADGIEDMADAPAAGAVLTIEQKRDTLRGLAGRITLKLGNNVKLAQDACVPIFAANGVQSISTCPEDKIDVVHAGLLAIANG